jgi:hypothetical protein
MAHMENLASLGPAVSAEHDRLWRRQMDRAGWVLGSAVVLTSIAGIFFGF